jgi:hypothetical protein
MSGAAARFLRSRWIKPATAPIPSDPLGYPQGRKPREGYVHSSVSLPEAIHEALRRAAFEERCKIHDTIMEGIGLALAKRRSKRR